MALTDTFVRQVKRGRSDRRALCRRRYPEVTLAEARERRETARKALDHGMDPILAKREAKRVWADATTG